METAIAKYTPIFSMPAKVAVVPEVAPGVLKISKKIKGATVERVPLQLYILLQMEVLGGGKVSKGGESIMVWAGIVQI